MPFAASDVLHAWCGHLLARLFAAPPPDKEFRASVRDLSTEDLYERLTRVDPVAAVKCGYNDRVRLERALEVFVTTGVPISDLQVRVCRVPTPVKATTVLRRVAHRGTACGLRVWAWLAQVQWEQKARYPALLVHIRTPRALLNRRINMRCATQGPTRYMFPPRVATHA